MNFPNLKTLSDFSKRINITLIFSNLFSIYSSLSIIISKLLIPVHPVVEDNVHKCSDVNLHQLRKDFKPMLPILMFLGIENDFLLLFYFVLKVDMCAK